MDINLNAVWPEWKIVKKISRGASGRVYEAVRDSDNDIAAIKIISIPENEEEIDEKRQVLSDDTIRRSYSDHAQAVLGEIEIMKKLRGANNIVNILDYKMTPKQGGFGYDIYIRMELLSPMEVHLASMEIDADPAAYFPSEKEVIKIGCDICRALETCHNVTSATKKPIIHRDIKPANILYHENSDIYKLGDFGISRELQGSNDDYTRGIGTPNYIAPEVAYYRDYDCRADIYSLGLVLYYLSNNKKLPFVREEWNCFQEDEAMLRRKRGEQMPAPEFASPALADIILKACSYDPNQRFPSAQELRFALEGLLSSHVMPSSAAEPSQFRNAAPTPSAETFGPKKNGMIGFMIAAISLCILAIVFYFAGRAPIFSDGDPITDSSPTKTQTEPSESHSSTEEASTEKAPTTQLTYQERPPLPAETEVSTEPPPPPEQTQQDGKTQETAVPVSLGSPCFIKTEPQKDLSNDLLRWCKLETTSNISNYFFSFVGIEQFGHVYMRILDDRQQEISSNWFNRDEEVLMVYLPSNTTYWISMSFYNITATYQLSVEEEVCDAGLTREQALPILLNTEYIKSLSIPGQNDWFQITTGEEPSIYRFYANGKINADNACSLMLAVYDTDGILLKEENYYFSELVFMDMLLSPNTVYNIKVFADPSFPNLGDYLISVTQNVCDAGTDQASAFPLTIGRYKARLDSNFFDWYVCTLEESGQYVVELHNIDVEPSMGMHCFIDSRQSSPVIAQNEHSNSYSFYADSGTRCYFKVGHFSDFRTQATGTYIIDISKEE